MYMDHIWSTCLYFKENEETTFEKQIPKLLGFRTVSQSLGGFAIQQRFVELDPFSGETRRLGSDTGGGFVWLVHI